MTIPQSVSDVLGNHVVLESESIDRMYLNVYVPQLQRIGGVVWYLRGHLGQRFASTAGVAPKTDKFVASINTFADERGVDVVSFKKGQRKDELTLQYQWVLERVKPERDHNKREVRRRNWWLFGEPNPKLRQQLAGMPRYIATVETAKHRVFQFLDTAIAPDNMLVCVALADAYFLGVLSSRVHVVWALAQGGTLEDRPRYNKSRCFETFPFPIAKPEQQARIRDLAEQINAHRKRVLAAHAELTLTGLYNVLVKVGAGDTALTTKEKAIHEKGLVAVLKSLHGELDAAVLDAYGWSDQPDEQTIRPQHPAPRRGSARPHPLAAPRISGAQGSTSRHRAGVGRLGAEE